MNVWGDYADHGWTCLRSEGLKNDENGYETIAVGKSNRSHGWKANANYSPC